MNISLKSPRIELSNDRFAERKCCQAFSFESEKFHRRQPNGISHCENQNLPFPLDDFDPHLIQQCLGSPHAPLQTAAPTVEALTYTYAVKSPLDTMARPKFAPKSTSSRRPIPKSHHLPHPCTRPTYDAKRHPYLIRRFSIMHGTDRRTYVRKYGRTDRPTDRPRKSLMTITRYAYNESDAA